MTIGVIGESLVDVVTDAAGVTVERPGGSPFNVAVALARLDVDVELFTAVGDDARGTSLLSHLTDEAISLTRGLSTASTAVARATIDADGHATYEFEMVWDPGFPKEGPELDVLHFGSLGAVMSPGANEVAAVVERYRAQKTLISYDPNWRTGVIDGDPRATVEANAARADVVKLSDEDAAAIYPGVDLDDVAHSLLDLGSALVVVTHGADGASGWTQKAFKQCPGTPVEVIDTVGAGDAFAATLISELAELDRDRIAALSRRELELLLDFASFVAAKTCEKVGADPPYIADLF
jgi:fructokinase